MYMDDYLSELFRLISCAESGNTRSGVYNVVYQTATFNNHVSFPGVNISLLMES